MPPVPNIQKVPPELRRLFRSILRDDGWGNIVANTATFNEMLESEGIPLKLGKTAVGKYAQLQADREEAFAVAEELMRDVGIDEEAIMHKTIMNMIAVQCINFMSTMREGGAQMDPKMLANLGKMLKDLMSSAGIREKISADERERAKQEAREEAAKDVEKVVKQAGLSKDLAASIISGVLGVPETPAAAS